jgi:hypothetical protein
MAVAVGGVKVVKNQHRKFQTGGLPGRYKAPAGN